jgi:hypothetical protein
MTRTTKPTNRAKAERIQHERWEDEGGQTTGREVPSSAGHFDRPTQRTTGSRGPGLPKQWSTGFVIEPLQSGHGSGVLKIDAAGNKRPFKFDLLPLIKGTHHE